MKNLFIAALLSFSIGINAQSIQCPADQTVHAFDLDQDYNSYGTPIVSGPGNYQVTDSRTIVDNACQGSFGIQTTITYNLVDVVTTAVLASCQQVINVQRADLSEFTFPEDYIIAEASLDDLTPQVTGYVEPLDYFNNSSVHIYTYADQVINSGPGVKILRTWTILDWCNGETREDIQIINVATLVTVGSGPLSVIKCSDEPVEVDNVIVRTDVPSYTIDYGTCSTSSSDLLSFVNCVAALNDIPANNNFILELEKDIDYLNGVSTLDLVLTQRHILGQSIFDESCKTLAADVNNDGRISAVDLLETRKLILGIYSSLPQSPSWRFYKQSVQGAVLDLTGDLKFSKSLFPLTELKIIAVKVGDVNNSAQR